MTLVGHPVGLATTARQGLDTRHRPGYTRSWPSPQEYTCHGADRAVALKRDSAVGDKTRPDSVDVQEPLQAMSDRATAIRVVLKLFRAAPPPRKSPDTPPVDFNATALMGKTSAPHGGTLAPYQAICPLEVNPRNSTRHKPAPRRAMTTSRYGCQSVTGVRTTGSGTGTGHGSLGYVGQEVHKN